MQRISTLPPPTPSLLLKTLLISAKFNFLIQDNQKPELIKNNPERRLIEVSVENSAEPLYLLVDWTSGGYVDGSVGEVSV